MRPLAVTTRADGEWLLIHQCTGCGHVQLNRIAGDDETQALLAIAIQPLTRLPFPWESLLATGAAPLARPSADDDTAP